MKSDQKLAASFRDPSGFLFRREGKLYRQVNKAYQEDYAHLVKSGLIEKLTKAGMLIPHKEAQVEPEDPALAYCVLEPELVDFISYPYEWSFSQMKDAALLTLAIQKQALEAGLSLKDASAYNIQFQHGHPLLIDTLSFEIYKKGLPWVAYRQFCQHFLAPLALMALTDIRLSQLMRVYIDGIPLDLASKLLPGSSRFNFGLATHIHLHAQAQKRYADKGISTSQTSGRGVSKMGLLGMVDSLEGVVRGLKWQPAGTEWGDYYDSTNYSRAAFDDKALAVKEFVAKVQPKKVWDLGANTGVFSQIAADQGALALAFDIDPAAVEKSYQDLRAQHKETRLLPLVMDLTNPSPSIGWQNAERDSLSERGPVDMVFALALVHHLAISNNLPLPMIAEYFSQLGKWLVVEFVPKDDSQVQRLLASREDIFDHYNAKEFVEALSAYFELRQTHPVKESKRTLYLLENKKAG
jgi:23S rRNA U2552 (ribose-2'-O)-methylase RlmE/FtsJ